VWYSLYLYNNIIQAYITTYLFHRLKENGGTGCKQNGMVAY